MVVSRCHHAESFLHYPSSKCRGKSMKPFVMLATCSPPGLETGKLKKWLPGSTPPVPSQCHSAET